VRAWCLVRATRSCKAQTAGCKRLRERNKYPANAKRELAPEGRSARSVGMARMTSKRHSRGSERPVIGAFAKPQEHGRVLKWVTSRSAWHCIRPWHSAYDRYNDASLRRPTFLAFDTKPVWIRSTPIEKSNGNRESPAALWQNGMATPERSNSLLRYYAL
jgi:hypothetical protein